MRVEYDVLGRGEIVDGDDDDLGAVIGPQHDVDTWAASVNQAINACKGNIATKKWKEVAKNLIDAKDSLGRLWGAWNTLCRDKLTFPFDLHNKDEELKSYVEQFKKQLG